MNKLFKLVCCLTMASPLFSQTDYPSTIDGLTATDLSNLLARRSSVPFGPVKLRKLIDQSIEAKRMDLISAFFVYSGTVGDLIDAVGRLSDNEFRQRITIMMLRTPMLNVWPNEGHSLVLTGGMAVVGLSNHNMEPFASIPKLLPNIRSLKEHLQTQAARNKLADEMEAALNAKAADGSAAPVAPGMSSSTAVPTAPVPKLTLPAATQKPPAPSTAPSSNSENTDRQETGNTAIFWLTTGTAIAVLLGWFVKSRKD